jgi:hypothetical protein
VTGVRRRAAAIAVLGVALLAVSVPGAGAAEPPPTVGMPQGNVQPPPTSAAGVGVAATATPVDGRVAVLIQNNGTKTARVDVVAVTATTRDGSRVTRARSREAFPQVLAPGEFALASVKFRRNDAPPGVTIAAKIRSTPVKATLASRALAVSNLVLSPPQTGSVAQTMGATATNPTSSWTARAPKVAVMCFGEARNPVALATARLSARTLRPGKQATVSVPLPTLCPAYLVAARAT